MENCRDKLGAPRMNLTLETLHVRARMVGE